MCWKTEKIRKNRIANAKKMRAVAIDGSSPTKELEPGIRPGMEFGPIINRRMPDNLKTLRPGMEFGPPLMEKPRSRPEFSQPIPGDLGQKLTKVRTLVNEVLRYVDDIERTVSGTSPTWNP